MVARAAPDPFVCKAVDLLNYATGMNNTNVTCSRQACTGCVDITMASILWRWSTDQQQQVTIKYNPNYVSIACANCTASTNINTVPTAVTATSDATAEPTDGASTGNKGEDGHSGIILGVIFGILVVVIAVILAVIWFRGRHSQRGGPERLNNDKTTGYKNRGARLESLNSDASDIEFTDLSSRTTGGPMHATLDVSSTRYVDLNSKGASSGRAGQYQNVKPTGQYENVKPNGQNVGVKPTNTPEYSTIGVQTSRPVNVYNMASPTQAPILPPANPRVSDIYNEPTNTDAYSLAQNVNLDTNDFLSNTENPYSEINESQRSSGTQKENRTSET